MDRDAHRCRDRAAIAGRYVVSSAVLERRSASAGATSTRSACDQCRHRQSRTSTGQSVTSRAGPRDLLRELDHEPVRVGDVNRPVPPWTVAVSEQGDAASPQSGGHRVDVLDHQHDLRRGLGAQDPVSHSARRRS